MSKRTFSIEEEQAIELAGRIVAAKIVMKILKESKRKENIVNFFKQSMLELNQLDYSISIDENHSEHPSVQSYTLYESSSSNMLIRFDENDDIVKNPYYLLTSW
ncbi:hypothetical protein I5Q27_00800 [Serratia marcescens]|nr:hypothetical protein [Serratia marcescens]